MPVPTSARRIALSTAPTDPVIPVDVRLPAESESPVPTVISSTAPVQAVVLPRIREVA